MYKFTTILFLCSTLLACGLFGSTDKPPTSRAVARSIVLNTAIGLKGLAVACVDTAELLDAGGDRLAAEKLIYNCAFVINKVKVPMLVAAQAVDNWAAEPGEADQPAWQAVGCAAKNLAAAGGYVAQELHVQLPPAVTDVLAITNTALQYVVPACKVPVFTVQEPPPEGNPI